MRGDVGFVRLQDGRPDARIALRESQKGLQSAADESLVNATVLQMRGECRGEKLRQMARQRHGTIVIVRIDELEPRAARGHELRDERLVAVDEPRLVDEEVAAR